MKKFILAVAILLGLSVLFVSCNKDNGGTGGNYAKLIIGTWKLPENGPGWTTYEFRADGTYILSTSAYGERSYSTNPIYYKLNGDRLTINVGTGVETTVIIQKITETEMVWQGLGGPNQTVTLIRVE